MRINSTRWPERETVTDATQDVQLATTQALANYWAKEYDWRKVEARLNALPQFITEIDELDIHFIHVRSKHEDALPLIVTHGWPGSVVEQLKIIDPLTDPTAHGGSASDAFDVVIPSIPGYGYSGKPTTTGWGPERVARTWVTVMKRLGYTKFVAQGGDWGAVIVDLMAVQAPPELLGIHTNMPGIFPAEIDQAAFSGAPAPSGLSADEKVAYERLQFVYQKGIAYGFQMGLRPQTLYGIADSPVGLAAYFLDHDARSYQLITRVFQGQAEGLTRDDILDNITITWLTNTALSGARLYWEYFGKGYFNAKGVSIPVAVSVFPDELYPAPRSWAEKAYPNLIHYNRLPKGGHFAAWEQPKLLSEEIRTGFRSLRSRVEVGSMMRSLANHSQSSRRASIVEALLFRRLESRASTQGPAQALRRGGGTPLPRNFLSTPSVSSFANRLLWGSSIQPEGVKVMKTQAWGWLTAAVLAAGLNSSYHNGGLQWAHQIADRVEHNSNAVLALATGRADQFLAEARMLKAVDTADSTTDVDAMDKQMDKQEAAENHHARCQFSTAMAEVQSTFDSSQSDFDRFQALSDREQARLTRLQANRVRIENEVRARLARVRIQTADFNPVTVDLPQVRCPRVRVHIQRMPRINVPAPDVHVEFSGPGPV